MAASSLPSSVALSLENSKAEYRRLGASGLYVSVPIVGCMSIGNREWAEWVLDEDKALPLLKAAYDRGVNTVRWSLPFILPLLRVSFIFYPSNSNGHGFNRSLTFLCPDQSGILQMSTQMVRARELLGVPSKNIASRVTSWC